MFSSQLTKIFFGGSFWFFLIAMFWNQVSLYMIDKYRSPRRRLRRVNLSHFIAILASLLYAYYIYRGWKQQQQALNLFDHYLLLTVIILLSSGVFAFTIYLLFSNDRDSFIPKADVTEVYKAREIKRSESILSTTNRRIAILEKELSAIPENWQPPSMIELKQLDPMYDQFKKEKEKNSSVTEFNFYSVVVLPSGNATIFHTKSIHTSRGDSYQHYILHYDRQEAAKDSTHNETTLLEFDEKPIDRYIAKNFKHVYRREEKVMTDLPECLRHLLKHEQNLAAEISTQMTSNTILPLGVIWYYVILLMVGNKIDYLVPVTRTAKALILLLSLCRFLFLGSYLSIILKQYAK